MGLETTCHSGELNSSRLDMHDTWVTHNVYYSLQCDVALRNVILTGFGAVYFRSTDFRNESRRRVECFTTNRPLLDPRTRIGAVLLGGCPAAGSAAVWGLQRLRTHQHAGQITIPSAEQGNLVLQTSEISTCIRHHILGSTNTERWDGLNGRVQVTKSKTKLSYDWRSICQSLSWGPRPDFYCCQKFVGLLSCALSGDRAGLSFTISVSPQHPIHSRVSVPQDSRP
jgi:hypothetical protein